MSEPPISVVREQSVARLEASRSLHSDPAALCRALMEPAWLGRVVGPPPGQPDLLRVEADLAFVLHTDRRVLTFRKAALVDIGVVSLDEQGCAGDIGWQAASFAPLFPVFAGRLVVQPTGLHLRGVYAPPSGDIGLLIDRMFLHYFAQRTADWFLDRLVANATLARGSQGRPETPPRAQRATARSRGEPGSA